MATIIPENNKNAITVTSSILNFFIEYKLTSILQQCNAYKIKGLSAAEIFKYLLTNVFEDRSMYMQFITGKFRMDCSKNTIYRFMRSQVINWLKFTTMLASVIINRTIRPLTSADRATAFIIDDSIFRRTGYKSTELASQVFDHVDMKKRNGFRLMALGWTDGNTFMPVNSCLLASSDKTQVQGPVYEYDKRSIAYRRRKMAQTKGTTVMIELLKEAIELGIQAKYVLFDTWFSNPAQISDVHKLGLNTIAMIKKSEKRKYSFWGNMMTINQIFRTMPKKRGRSSYLLSVHVMTGPRCDIPAKIVFVRNRNNRKDWIALISTDVTLSEEEIIRIYGKRWKIEVFFKTCKSMLNLGRECHSTSYDALTAHVAVVFVRYMFISLEQRKDCDDRSLGELFYNMIDELADITYSESMFLLVEVMVSTVKELLKLSDEQIQLLVDEFYNKLPSYLQNRLKCKNIAA